MIDISLTRKAEVSIQDCRRHIWNFCGVIFMRFKTQQKIYKRKQTKLWFHSRLWASRAEIYVSWITAVSKTCSSFQILLWLFIENTFIYMRSNIHALNLRGSPATKWVRYFSLSFCRLVSANSRIIFVWIYSLTEIQNAVFPVRTMTDTCQDCVQLSVFLCF